MPHGQQGRHIRHQRVSDYYVGASCQGRIRESGGTRQERIPHTPTGQHTTWTCRSQAKLPRLRRARSRLLILRCALIEPSREAALTSCNFAVTASGVAAHTLPEVCNLAATWTVL